MLEGVFFFLAELRGARRRRLAAWLSPHFAAAAGAASLGNRPLGAVVGGRRVGVVSRVVPHVLDVARGVARDWVPLGLARVDHGLGDVVVLEHLGRLDERRREAHLDVPLDVAVEEEDARVVGLDAQPRVRAAVDADDVSPRRRGAGVAGPVKDAGAALRSLNDLELVAVQVEGVDCWIKIVDDDLDNVTVVDDERQDRSVHTRVCIVGSDGRRSIQGRCLLHDVCLIVEAHTEVDLQVSLRLLAVDIVVVLTEECCSRLCKDQSSGSRSCRLDPRPAFHREE